ncbi:MAG: HPP family protein [Bacillota bacterium]
MGLPVKEYEINRRNNADMEKCVRDIMVPLEGYSSVSADTSVRNAIYILKNSISSRDSADYPVHLLVFENKKLVGFVGIQELIASVQPPNIREDWYRGWNVANWVEPVFMKGLFSNLCFESAGKTVMDIMEPCCTALKTDSTLEEAAFKLYREKRDMVPVVDNEGEIVGMLRSSDLFKEMADILL